MAKYVITHKCGHKQEVYLFGSMKDRENRIKYLESIECDDCRKNAANAASLAAKESRGLADLTGTEKQIAWANTIREKAYKCLDALKPFATNDSAKKMIDNWSAKMNVTTEAKFWIDNRFEIPTDADTSMARINISKFNSIFA